MPTIELTSSEADQASKIQGAMDRVAQTGGTVVLPEMDTMLDRGLELRSGVELRGRGEGTVLRKGPGRIYPLTGYHNYGMCDVPLQSAAGLDVGMTVSVHDDVRRGFYETFARITWIDGNRVGLDHGIEADYAEDAAPRLTTAYPLLFGHGVHDGAVRDLRLEGNGADQEAEMGGCRGAALYLCRSRDVEFTGVRGNDYRGEGLGFQMCRDIVIRDCTFTRITGNGFHPGAGSTNCRFENCTGTNNGKSGLFFCVRANHITVAGGTFERNALGMSIGTRDCHNRIENCRIAENQGPGILVRDCPVSCPVHSVTVTGCEITGNAGAEGEGQVVIEGGAHDLAFSENRISAGTGKPAGIVLAPQARRVYLDGNEFVRTNPDIAGAAECRVDAPPPMECGYGTGGESIFRHLG